MIPYKDFIFLTESLDNPYEMNLIPDRYVENHDGTVAGYFDKDTLAAGISNRKVYSIGDAGYISTFERRGAIELHHYDKQSLGSTGSIADPTKQSPNPRFVATMFHHAKNLIDNDKTVRVVGRNNVTVETYYRLAKLIARKHNYTVSDMIPHHESPNELSEFTITKNRQ